MGEDREERRVSRLGFTSRNLTVYAADPLVVVHLLWQGRYESVSFAVFSLALRGPRFARASYGRVYCRF
jgi:hypothetical protein